MPSALAGKVVLVTGASKGIGAQIARSFGSAGARVAVGYARDKVGAKNVVEDIYAGGAEAIAVQGDLTKADELEAMITVVAEELGPLDVLVNNAGVYEFRVLEEADDAHLHRIFDHNVFGLLRVTRIAIRNFNADGGSIINISSLSALGSAPGTVAYAASKAAVNTITKVLALELAERNIRVNAIMPGYVDTEGLRAVGLKGSQQEAQIVAATPLAKRPGRPSDLSPVAIFLATPASAWMTGEVLTVAGGLR